MKKNGLVWNFLEPQVVETSDHTTNKTNSTKYLVYHPAQQKPPLPTAILYARSIAKSASTVKQRSSTSKYYLLSLLLLFVCRLISHAVHLLPLRTARPLNAPQQQLLLRRRRGGGVRWSL